jgi:hypothetical protein
MSNPATTTSPAARRKPANWRPTTVNFPKVAPPWQLANAFWDTRAAQPVGGLYYALGFFSLTWGRNDEQKGGSRNVPTKRVARGSKFALLVAGVIAAAAMTISPSYAANDTEIYIVQGLPGKQVDVALDGKSIAEDVKTATVAGPFKVNAGSRMVTFSDDGSVLVENTFSIKDGSTVDVVAHLPASSSGDPVVTVFEHEPVEVPKGKACLLVAHTAAVPPADIRVNDQVLFANVANGESLQLMVPVATYKVSIVPTGETEPVFIGPVSLTVKGEAVNRVYAVGDPEKKTMNVVVHVIDAPATGSDEPSEVNTGTGGQAIGDVPSLAAKLVR